LLVLINLYLDIFIFSSFHLYKDLLHFNLIIGVSKDAGHSTSCFGLHVVLHLHALNGDKGVALFNLLSNGAEDLDHASRHGASNLTCRSSSGADGLLLFCSFLDERDLFSLPLRRVTLVVELSDVVVAINIVVDVFCLLLIN